MTGTRRGYVRETEKKLEEALKRVKRGGNGAMNATNVARVAGYDRRIIGDRNTAYPKIRDEILSIAHPARAANRAARALAKEKQSERSEVSMRLHQKASELVGRWNLSENRLADGTPVGTRSMKERLRLLQIVPAAGVKKV